MTTRVKFDFDIPKALSSVGMGVGGKAQLFFNNELIRVSDPFVPMDTGILKNSSRVEPNNLGISYNTPYARRWYFEEANFQGAPVRGTRWVDRAWAVNKQEIINGMQSALDRGLFND